MMRLASATFRCSATMSSLRRSSFQALMVSSPYWNSSGFFSSPVGDSQDEASGSGLIYCHLFNRFISLLLQRFRGCEVTDDVVARGVSSKLHGVKVGHEDPETLLLQLLHCHIAHRRVEGTRTLVGEHDEDCLCSCHTNASSSSLVLV